MPISFASICPRFTHKANTTTADTTTVRGPERGSLLSLKRERTSESSGVQSTDELQPLRISIRLSTRAESSDLEAETPLALDSGYLGMYLISNSADLHFVRKSADGAMYLCRGNHVDELTAALVQTSEERRAWDIADGDRNTYYQLHTARLTVRR